MVVWFTMSKQFADTWGIVTSPRCPHLQHSGDGEGRQERMGMRSRSSEQSTIGPSTQTERSTSPACTYAFPPYVCVFIGAGGARVYVCAPVCTCTSVQAALPRQRCKRRAGQGLPKASPKRTFYQQQYRNNSTFRPSSKQ